MIEIICLPYHAISVCKRGIAFIVPPCFIVLLRVKYEYNVNCRLVASSK